MRPVYLDNAATTRVDDGVAAVVLACLLEDFGNPSSSHRIGLAATRRIKAARAQLGTALGDEDGALGTIIWTSGGTEADALGVAGAARARAGRGRHIVVTAFEHPAVLGAAKQLEAEGFHTTTVPIRSSGVVAIDDLLSAVTDETVVVACMLVQNELGTIQPVAELARAVRSRAPRVHLHCDAVQALGKIPLDVRALGCHSVALSAHKLHGPKGVGALWLKQGARVTPLWSGGGQQDGVRSGTENVPGIAGFAEAARLAHAALVERAPHAARLRDRLVATIVGAGIGAIENCVGQPRVPQLASLAFPGVPAEPLLHALEARGIFVSAGSACASRDRHVSPALAALGHAPDVGTLRVSLAHSTTLEEIDVAARAIIAAAAELGGSRRRA